jgi:hypothetical protein
MKNWLTPIIIASLLFVVVRPTFAQVVERQANLAQYLTVNNVEVGKEVNNGYLRVYYLYEGSKNFVSQENQNSKHPHSNGEYIVWVTEIGDQPGQIFLYHIPTDSIIQITNSSTNLQPAVSRDGRVVWEGWIDGGWQVFFFDGKSVRQLTSGDISMDPEIEGDNIIYGRKDIVGVWRAVVYSISRDTTKEVITGIATKRPALENGKIILGRVGGKGGEEFPLTVEDLFLLDLGPLTVEDEVVPSPTPEPQPETVTEEEIIEELEATPSAEATSSARTE